MQFIQWTNYFKVNQSHFDHIDWGKGAHLTPHEKSRLSKSLREFQRGENSEGRNLMRYAKDLGDKEYINTIKLFIKEEQSHAKVLGKFLELNHIAKIRNHWIDTVFRKLRTLGSLEHSIIVLLTAEVIATVYYKALRDASSSVLLKQICEQILEDEELHINFQSFTLGVFHKKRNAFGMFVKEKIRTILMAGTTVLVWVTHNKVLTSGGYSLSKFWIEIFEEFNRSKQMIYGNKEIVIRPKYLLSGL